MTERTKGRYGINREKMILDYLPLVKYVIGRLPFSLPAHLDVEDLFGIGVLGLIRAAQTYKTDKGAIFKTYAYNQIRGAILDELRKQDPIPRSHKEKIRLVERKTEELEGQLGRPPTIEELEDATGISGTEMDSIFASVKAMNVLSLEKEVGAGSDHDGGTLRDLLQSPVSDPSEAVSLEERKRLLAEAIESLPPDCRKVIVLYYQKGLFLREIGEVLRVTESRVSQIHSRALYLLNQEIQRKEG